MRTAWILCIAITGYFAVSCAPKTAATPPAENAPAKQDAPQAQPEKPEAPPSARVAEVTDIMTHESIGDRRARIVFDNPTSKPCKLMGYKVLWGQSSKQAELDGLIIPPGQTRERWLRLHPNDGDIASLTDINARVELDITCGN